METTQAAGGQSEVQQPGLSQLREAVENQARQVLPRPPKLRQDGLAGLNVAISSVPDGMASGILAGVNPIYGLYACMVGPLMGGFFSSTRLMVITTTSAAALAAGQALSSLPPEARVEGLIVLAILVGAVQVLFGVLGLGRLTRFVSYSVMTGFLIGISALTILSQLPTISGYEPAGGNKVTQTVNLLLNPGHVNLTSLAMAALTLILAVTLPRTKLGSFGTLLAIVVPSVVVLLLHLGSVQIVQDVGTIPRGIPLPTLPSLSGLTPDVITGAVAVAVIILVQGAGVSQSVPNPTGSRASASRDFIAEGLANVAAGFFRGIPIGGSLSATTLNVSSGARTRWAAIFSGLLVALLVILLPGLVSQVAMPALGALLILVGASAVKPSDVQAIWNTGWPARMASAATFVATLFLPIQIAVGIGVVLSAILYLNESSAEIAVVQMVERPDGRIEERKAPRRLPSNQVTMLDVYGALSYAGARTLERLLPSPRDAQRPVVILRLRGLTTVGATLTDVLATYAEQLQAAHGRLYLAGVSDEARDQLTHSDTLGHSDAARIYEATPIVGESARQAYADARAWLADQRDDSASEEASSAQNATS